MRYKSFPGEVKVKDIDKGIFEGYASVYEVEDSYGEVIHRGAADKTLKENRDRIKVLWLHTLPFGMPVKVSEDDHGIYTMSKATPTQENKDRLAYIKDRVVDALSIGFDLVKDKFHQDNDGILHIHEIKLWEYSPVIWGANPLAMIEKSKGIISITKDLEIIGDGYLSGDQKSIEAAIDRIKALTAGEPPAGTLPGSVEPPKEDKDLAAIKALCQEVGSRTEALKLEKELKAFAESLKVRS
ncbi:MAG: HK97 family phage prohead protease [Sulfurimonas sp.]|jgi:hypothetical protein|uniref:HK97 family phage prohead protease n=1 Tax=Sulfurimonas sp. TaxID=2022749 RepID=UPI0025CB9D7E|nr:HK97 family phage prohead protease [Sulfurimonas sp.]MCK9492682.1 HK97 family phage prohead protease [Sulfurimonas sp.]